MHHSLKTLVIFWKYVLSKTQKLKNLLLFKKIRNFSEMTISIHFGDICKYDTVKIEYGKYYIVSFYAI